MKILKRTIELSLVFSNSLLVGFVLGIIVLIVLFPTHFLISLVKSEVGWERGELIYLGLLMAFGSAVILTVRFIIETKGKSSDLNRFKRVHSRFYKFHGSFAEKELLDILSNNGYREIKIENDNLKEVINASYPWGIFEFPKEYGGLKKFEDKNLKIIIDSSAKTLKINMGPKKWYIPTAVTHSNYYFLDSLEKVLQNSFDLEILECR